MPDDRDVELPFSKVFQIGVVVRDLDAAMVYYASLGIGPFEERKGPGATARTFYGQPADDLQVRVSTASMGPVQFELIQPVRGRSVPADYLAKHGEGINHLGFLVADCQRVVRTMQDKGFQVIFGGKIPGGGEFVYLDTDKKGGVVFELVQPPPLAKPEKGSG